MPLTLLEICRGRGPGVRWVLFLVARVLVRQKKRRLGHKGGGGHVKTEAEMGRRRRGDVAMSAGAPEARGRVRDPRTGDCRPPGLWERTAVVFRGRSAVTGDNNRDRKVSAGS